MSIVSSGVRHCLVVALIIAAMLQSALASGLVPSVLNSVAHPKAELTVVSPSGETVVYSPTQVEVFATYSLTTQTPWRTQPATFEGILLSDLLTAHGLHKVDAIVVTAADETSVVISRPTWESEDFVIATRVDGEAYAQATRGPFQIVLNWPAFQASYVVEVTDLVARVSEIAPLR